MLKDQDQSNVADKDRARPMSRSFLNIIFGGNI